MMLHVVLRTICVYLMTINTIFADKMSDEMRHTILNTHNVLRSQTARGKTGNQPAAINMLRLEWSDELAITADMWVSQCETGHDKPEYRAIPLQDYSWIGQIWGRIDNANYSRIIELLFNEHQYYTYSTNECYFSGFCKNYLQLVWADTNLVGCAVATCPNTQYKNYLVCNYAPGYSKNLLPYKTGRYNHIYRTSVTEVCSECKGKFPVLYIYCDNGLCAMNCRNENRECTCSLSQRLCQNNSSFDSYSCKCRCRPDFYGKFCEIKCSDDVFYHTSLCINRRFKHSLYNRVPINQHLCSTGYILRCRKTCQYCGDY